MVTLVSVIRAAQAPDILRYHRAVGLGMRKGNPRTQGMISLKHSWLDIPHVSSCIYLDLRALEPKRSRSARVVNTYIPTLKNPYGSLSGIPRNPQGSGS